MASVSVAEKTSLKSKGRVARPHVSNSATKITSVLPQGSECMTPEKKVTSANREEKGQGQGKLSKGNTKDIRQSSAGRDKSGNKDGDKKKDQAKVSPSQVKLQLQHGKQEVEENKQQRQAPTQRDHQQQQTSTEQERKEQQQDGNTGQQKQEENQVHIDQEKTAEVERNEKVQQQQKQQQKREETTKDLQEQNKQEMNYLQEVNAYRLKDQATSPMPVEFLQNDSQSEGPTMSSESTNQASDNKETLTKKSVTTAEVKNSTETEGGTGIDSAVEQLEISAKRILPRHKMTRTNTSGEVDAILARKISSSDLSSSKERPFAANKIIRPPPKSSSTPSLLSSSSSPALSSRQLRNPRDGPIKEVEELGGVAAADDQQTAWRDVGEVEVLRRTKCRRIYSKQSQEKDVALFYKNGAFFALEAWCSHMGKFFLCQYSPYVKL